MNKLRKIRSFEFILLSKTAYITFNNNKKNDAKLTTVPLRKHEIK